MEWIRETDQGVYLSIQVAPRASRNEVQGLHNDALKIRLTAPPVDGKANKALTRFLSKTLRVPSSSISIQSGETGRKKVLTITGISAADITERLLP
jgi:uncharacterized protein (TIGR00251 family)